MADRDRRPARRGARGTRGAAREAERYHALSQLLPWHRLDPELVARLAERWHSGLARRATWRLDNGVRLHPARAALRADAAIPHLWRLPFLR